MRATCPVPGFVQLMQNDRAHVVLRPIYASDREEVSCGRAHFRARALASVAGQPTQPSKYPINAAVLPRGAARYLTALITLIPAAEATPSCWPVPPLVPMAPMSRPLTTIGRPPSEAIGRASSGKLMKPVLPAANWSANTLLGRRNSAEVRAFACARETDAFWVPSARSK